MRTVTDKHEKRHLTRVARNGLRHLLHHILQQDFMTLLALVVIASGTLFFIELSENVLEQNHHTIDERILLAMRNPADLNDPLGPEWVQEAMRDYTALGGAGVLTLLTISVVGFLFLQKKPHAAWLITVTVLGGIILSLLLKQGFDRPRPDLVPHASYVTTASFPSGHSMLSAITYLTLGALLASLQTSRIVKLYLIVISVLVTLLVGVSRVYLGVHWPTDVLAGWSAGAVWASLCWIVALWLQQRGQIEQPVPEPEEEQTEVSA